MNNNQNENKALHVRKKAKLAVTGAYGWVGSNVCAWLESQGHEVIRLDMRLGAKGGVQWNCQEEPSSAVAQALSTVDALVHCAGHVHRPVETEHEKKLFYEVNTKGTERIIRVCEQNGCKRIVFVSTIALYAWNDEKPRTEEDKIECLTAYADSKHKAELAVMQSRLDWRIARLSTVFGSGDKANFYKLAEAIKKRRFFIPGAGAASKSVISVSRAGELLGKLALLGNPKHRLVNFGSPEPPNLSQICSAFSSVCRFPRPIHLPMVVSSFVGLMGDMAGFILPSFPVNSKVIGKLKNSTVVNTQRQNEMFPDITWRRFEQELADSADYYRG